MQSANAKADRRLAAIVAGIVLLVGGVITYVIVQPMMQATTPISIGTSTLYAEVAQTEQAREKGLSGRESLAANRALLMVFEKDDLWPIWMKDMKFSIDIVWLNAQKRIVHVQQNVQPSSYPDTRYRPSEPARYVIELPAGQAFQYGFRKGTDVAFSVPGESS